MQNEIEPEFQRTLDPGTGKGVVTNGKQPIFGCQSSDRFQVNQLQQGIGRGFDPDHFGVLFDHFFQTGEVCQIDKGEVEIRGSSSDAFEQPEGAAVQIVAGNPVGA